MQRSKNVGIEVHTIMTQRPIVTPNHNCIIALEHPDTQQSVAEAVRELMRYRDAGIITLRVPIDAALENQRQGEERAGFLELIEHYR